MVDSGFAVGRGVGLLGLVVVGTVVVIGILACMWAAIYGYESFKDGIRTEERAYLLVRAANHDDIAEVRGASEVVRVLVEHGARRGLSQCFWAHRRAYDFPLE